MRDVGVGCSSSVCRVKLYCRVRTAWCCARVTIRLCPHHVQDSFVVDRIEDVNSRSVTIMFSSIGLHDDLLRINDKIVKVRIPFVLPLCASDCDETQEDVQSCSFSVAVTKFFSCVFGRWVPSRVILKVPAGDASLP